MKKIIFILISLVTFSLQAQLVSVDALTKLIKEPNVIVIDAPARQQVDAGSNVELVRQVLAPDRGVEAAIGAFPVDMPAKQGIAILPQPRDIDHLDELARLVGHFRMKRELARAAIEQRHVPVLVFHRIANDGPATLAAVV